MPDLFAAPYSEIMTPVELDIYSDEGYKRYPYRCTSNKLTIGIGYNLDAGMPEDEAIVLMRYRTLKNYNTLLLYHPWVSHISEKRKQAFLNMIYQLGIGGFLAFKKMLEAAKAGKWEKAAVEALNSKWAREDTPSRAKRIANIIKEG
jgi:lysozyme